jgi:hypothetical protein
MDSMLARRTVVVGIATLVVAAAALAADSGARGTGGAEPPAWLVDAHSTAAPAAGKGAEMLCLDLGGTWLGTQEVGTVTLETWTPLDRFGHRYAQQYELLNLDPTLWGMFPVAVRLTVFAGEMERISLRDLEWQSVAHALDAANGIVYTLLMRGTATLSGCNRAALTGTFAVYAPGQNPFTEEPAYGCYPMSPATSTRMGAWAACEAP